MLENANVLYHKGTGFRVEYDPNIFKGNPYFTVKYVDNELGARLSDLESLVADLRALVDAENKQTTPRIEDAEVGDVWADRNGTELTFLGIKQDDGERGYIWGALPELKYHYCRDGAYFENRKSEFDIVTFVRHGNRPVDDAPPTSAGAPNAAGPTARGA